MAEHFYTIQDVVKATGIPATAIRFYDKRGLLTFVKRAPSGIRIFTDSDVDRIRMIRFLRNLDMPVNVISTYVGLSLQGESTRAARQKILADRKAELEKEEALTRDKVAAAEYLGKFLESPTVPGIDDYELLAQRGIPKNLAKFFEKDIAVRTLERK